MYEPAPPRRKKTNIRRSRTGCKLCRQRRKKCDGKNPCSMCSRLQRPCEPNRPVAQFRMVEFGQTPVKEIEDSAETMASSTKDLRYVEAFHFDSHTNLHNYTASKQSLSFEITAKENKLDPWMTGMSTGSTGQRLQSSVAITQPGMTFNSILTKLDKTQFYLKIWHDHCAPTLHRIFNEAHIFRDPPTVVTYAMAALSACQLSRRLPQKKDADRLGDPKNSFRPEVNHQSRAREFYILAMQSVRRWSSTEFQQNPTVVLIVLILFCHVESMTGTFQDFALHSGGIRKLIGAKKGYSGTQLMYGQELYAAYRLARLHNWWRRVHFTSSQFLSTSSSLLPHSLLNSDIGSGISSRLRILSILCESHRLSLQTLVRQWDKSMIEMACPLTGSNTSHTWHESKMVTIIDQGFMAASMRILQNLKELTARWHGNLPLAELPVDRISQNKTEMSQTVADLEIEGLQFVSHVAAMNYAYYITARIIQDTTHLANPSSDSVFPSVETEMWIVQLLRIAVGISWDDCRVLNCFTIGFAGLLLAAALRTRRGEVSVWIQRWLEGNAQITLEEGGFPVWQIIRVLRAINRERQQDRDILAVFLPVDDGGGIGKHYSYNSQTIESLVLYEKCQQTGALSTREVSI